MTENGPPTGGKTDLSAASYEDMQAWLELVLRRAKRSVKDETAN